MHKREHFSQRNERNNKNFVYIKYKNRLLLFLCKIRSACELFMFAHSHFSFNNHSAFQSSAKCLCSCSDIQLKFIHKKTSVGTCYRFRVPSACYVAFGAISHITVLVYNRAPYIRFERKMQRDIDNLVT